MTLYYKPPITPTRYAVQCLLSEDMSVMTWVDCNGVRWPLSGGLAPVLGAQEGVILEDVKGFMAPFKHLSQTSARQDGVDPLDTVYDPLELDMSINVGAFTPNNYRAIWRQWVDGWDPKRTGRMVNYTQFSGEWWVDLRLLKENQDLLSRGPARHTVQKFMWAAKADFPFWKSFDSTSQLVANSTNTWVDPLGINPPNFLSSWNRGNQDGWIRYIFQGPGTLTIQDADGKGPYVFGPLAAGQSVLITTEPRRRSIVELTTQDNLYPLLKGRFQASVPAGKVAKIRASVTGAQAGRTAITSALTPYRNWPE